jgi:hypothetical protein
MFPDVIHVAVMIRIANAALLVYLMNFYWKNYRKIKSGFTSGLLVFSFLLLLQNVSAIYLRLFSGVDYGVEDEISMHNLFLNVIELGSLTTLVYITRK